MLAVVLLYCQWINLYVQLCITYGGITIRIAVVGRVDLVYVHVHIIHSTRYAISNVAGVDLLYRWWRWTVVVLVTRMFLLQGDVCQLLFSDTLLVERQKELTLGHFHIQFDPFAFQLTICRSSHLNVMMPWFHVVSWFKTFCYNDIIIKLFGGIELQHISIVIFKDISVAKPSQQFRNSRHFFTRCSIDIRAMMCRVHTRETHMLGV